MPALSIIIPTHKRAPILAECLEHIEQQTIADKLEVIVVSDGHDDETASLFANRTWRVPVQFLEIEKSQQGTARNRGVEKANADRCLFIGDDMFLKPNACELHIKNKKFLILNSAFLILGHVTWDPTLEITPVMKWLEQSGWQFGFPMIARYAHKRIPQDIQHLFTYTSQISLPTSMAKKYPFREDITLYGWEDIEWGMRLRDAGIPLIYEPDAITHHHHTMTLGQSLKRMETLGKSVVKMTKLIPNFDRVPRGWKRIAYKIAAILPTMSGKHRAAFLRGIKESEAMKR